MKKIEFELGREDEKCIDFKSNIIKTNLTDCYIIEENRFGDNRGYFTSITNNQLEELNFKRWSQKSESMSCKGTIRGLHFQRAPYCQAKVVSCTKGAVLDVVVDMRKDSPTYKQYTTVELTPENGRMLYVPRGFAHGFVALTDDATFNYMVDNEYAPKYEGGILYNDPEINIPWNKIYAKYEIVQPLLSEKDKLRSPLSETEKEINFFKREKRYLITGVNGQLGYDIVKELRARGEENILALGKNDMDITNREQVMSIIKAYKPDVIFHCAAWTAVDKAEEMKNECMEVNVEGTKNLTDASLNVGAKIIYMSTDYIFDGTKDMNEEYSERDAPNPMNVYGKSKYEGEKAVRNNPKHFIARISWVFGINGANFIKTMLKVGENRDFVTVVDDQIGSPTYTVDLAKVLVQMAESEKYGTYNINNEGFCTWAEFCEYFYKVMGLNTEVRRVSTEEYYNEKTEEQMKKIAYRPRNSKLSKDKLENVGFSRLPSWENATERYCKQLTKSQKWNILKK